MINIKNIFLRIKQSFFHVITRILLLLNSLARGHDQRQNRAIKLHRQISGGLRQQDSLTLVIEIIGVLLCIKNTQQQGSIPFNYINKDKKKKTKHILFRNYVKEFIESVSKDYHIVLFTQHPKDYIELGFFFAKFLQIQHCIKNNVIIKHLSYIRANLNTTVYVDYDINQVRVNTGQSLHINEFTGKQDDKLQVLMDKLEAIADGYKYDGESVEEQIKAIQDDYSDDYSDDEIK
ncbi:hypothetical protein pb186bvf_011529 [Paramecium bursaria]